MTNEDKNTILKKVGDFIIEPSPFSKGDKSKIYKGWKKDSPHTLYAIKCIPNDEFRQMIDSVSHEIASATYYKNTGCIIEYKETTKSHNNYYMCYLYYDSLTLDQMLS